MTAGSEPGNEQGLPIVVALGSVEEALVSDVLDGHCRFVTAPGEAELAVAAGAIVRADARVDEALLRQAPGLRVIARTGVGVDLVDVPAATARGIAVVVTPGAGAGAVAEGAIGMALHLVKRFGPLTALVREGRWAERGTVGVGDLAARSDVITLHLPLSDQTRHLIDDAFLARVKPGAVLVNPDWRTHRLKEIDR
jgi:D-3-phosphoglycerate dehydrogenase / 2-oxoglutarate reductase